MLVVKYRIVFEKWYNRWLQQLTILLPGRIYITLSPWHFGDFRNIFLRNIGEDQKNLTISARGSYLVLRHIMVNLAQINTLRSQKG